MTVRLSTPASEIVINLDGPDGNVFSLMALAKKLAHFEGNRVSPIIAEMSSKGYEHAIKVFDKHFGHLVVLETSDQSLIDILA
jgi:hypothetical protein